MYVTLHHLPYEWKRLDTKQSNRHDWHVSTEVPEIITKMQMNHGKTKTISHQLQLYL